MRADQIVKGRTVAITVAAVAVLGLGGVWAANATGIFERPAPEPTAVVQNEPTATPTATVTPTPTPTPVVQPPVEAPAEPAAPEIVLCPEGTVAGAVDELGNESACYETNEEGQQCIAYDDANNCTQYYKP